MSKYLKYVKHDYIEPDILFVGLWLDGVMWYVGWMLVHAQLDWLRVAGWLFFGMKGITIIVTFAGLLAHPVKGWDLLTGRYRFDTRPMRGLVQALTRFTWELPQLEVGYWVAKPYWNQGICTEALRLLLNYLINEKHFDNIWADYFTKNPASGRVMQKCGFKDTGKLHQCSNLVGGDKDMVKIFKLETNI